MISLLGGFDAAGILIFTWLTELQNDFHLWIKLTSTESLRNHMTNTAYRSSIKLKIPNIVF